MHMLSANLLQDDWATRGTAAHEAGSTLRFAAASRARPAPETHLPRAQRLTRRLRHVFSRPVHFDTFVSSKRNLPKLANLWQRPRIAILAILQQLLLISKHCEARLCSQRRATRANAR